MVELKVCKFGNSLGVFLPKAIAMVRGAGPAALVRG